MNLQCSRIVERLYLILAKTRLFLLPVRYSTDPSPSSHGTYDTSNGEYMIDMNTYSAMMSYLTNSPPCRPPSTHFPSPPSPRLASQRTSRVLLPCMLWHWSMTFQIPCGHLHHPFCMLVPGICDTRGVQYHQSGGMLQSSISSHV